MSTFALRSGLLLAFSLVAFGNCFAVFSDSDSRNLSSIDDTLYSIQGEVHDINEGVSALQGLMYVPSDISAILEYFVSLRVEDIPDILSSLSTLKTDITSSLSQLYNLIYYAHYEIPLQSIDSKIATTSKGIKVDTGLDVQLTQFQDQVLNCLTNIPPYQPAFLTNLVATLLPVDIWKGRYGHLLTDYFTLIFDKSPTVTESSEFSEAFRNYGHRIGTIQDFMLHLNYDLIPRNSPFFTSYDTYLQVPYRTFLREYSGLTTADTSYELKAVKDLGKLYNSQFGTKVVTDAVLAISNAVYDSSFDFVDYKNAISKTTSQDGPVYSLSGDVRDTVTGIGNTFAQTTDIGDSIVQADTNAVTSISDSGYAQALNNLSLDLETLSGSITMLRGDDLQASLDSLPQNAPDTFAINVGALPMLGGNTTAAQLAFPIMRDARLTLFLHILFGLLKLLLFYSFGSQIIDIVTNNLFAPGG